MPVVRETPGALPREGSHNTLAGWIGHNGAVSVTLFARNEARHTQCAWHVATAMSVLLRRLEPKRVSTKTNLFGHQTLDHL
jgi:hypothetical protein